MNKQKFQHGDLVHIAADLGDSMSHFEVNVDAIVIGSYADQFGGDTHDIYTVFIKDNGTHSWYDEDQLTLLARGRLDLLASWKTEQSARIAQQSDLDWIFAQDDIDRMSGSSIIALARCLGISEDQMWGNHGEGFVFYENAVKLMGHAKPFLEAHDKSGWLAYSKTMKESIARR